jgi:hypothetical protein
VQCETDREEEAVRRVVLLLASLAALLLAQPASASAAFGFLPGDAGFRASAIADGGEAATNASSHPYQLSFGLGFKQDGSGFADGDLRDLTIELPAGMTLNPTVVPRCTAVDFNTPRSSPFAASLSGESCIDASQVGTVEVETSAGGGESRRFGVFNLTPPPGVAAQLGFAPYGAPIVLDVAVREDAGGYALDLRARNVPQAIDIRGIELDLWGTPWDVSHNGERGDCLNEAEPEFPWAKCSVGPPAAFKPLAFLTLPARCGTALAFTARARSWQQPATVSRAAVGEDVGGDPAILDSCAALHFDPIPVAQLSDKKASSPSGFGFRLVGLGSDNETLTDPDQPAETQARRAVVRLPQGVTVNPSVGAGLSTCAPHQYQAETALSPPGAGCPDGSRIGSFRVRSPLFSEAMEGFVYLAAPDDPGTSQPGAENPFDTLIALYLVAKSPERGAMIRLAGKTVPDPSSGRLTAIFEDLPQLPYTDMELNLPSGQRAFLVTPPSCGPAVTEIELTPWAQGQPVFNTISSSPIETGIGAGPCPPPGTPPFAPRAVAGAVNSNVGSYTPYFVRLSRSDTEQEITSYSLELPKGITGKLAGIPFCSEAAIGAARGRRGRAEAASPSCPAASQVGRTLTGYGVGSALTYAEGRVYLAGPYNGAPLSLVTVNSATVGPFDLGTIVIRSAFQVDRRTAQLRIDSRASDPIPHIIAGVPLHLREIRVYVDRHRFTHNPSSCEPSRLVSTLTGSGASFESRADDSTAVASSHFQLLNCLALGFRPKLGLRLRGGSKRGDYPELRATYVSRGERDANLKEIAVSTPRSLFLAQSHIRKICTRVQFDAGRCPAGSVYGKAVAVTPLFDEPLRGEVYLRSSDNPLPDLVTLLRAGAIEIVLEGRIGPSRKGGIRAFFSDIPDAPIDRFTMTLYGGKRGLLTNSQNICARPPLASVKALGQNNIGAVFSSELRGQCGKKKTRKGRR